MKKIIISLSFAASFLLISCELTDFEFQDNPNELTPESVNPDFLLNEIQVLFIEIMEDLSTNTDEIMRYENMNDVYTATASNSVLNSEWEDLYKLGVNVKTLENLASNDNTLGFHSGIAKILKAYCFTAMVDYIGDIPFSEAFDPSNFPNPDVDPGADIYNVALAEIDVAISNFNNNTAAPLLDLYYGGDRDKWIRMANTLKLKLQINRRLIDPSGSKSEITNLLLLDNLIESPEDDFQVSYSDQSDPESRSVYFRDNYLNEGVGDYVGNYFLWLLKDSKAVRDPRLRYYIYRQTLQHPGDLGFLRCSNDGGITFLPEYDFCYVGDFYWGRDHGDDEGIPPDRFLKSTVGIYPGGGAFDADNGVPAFESSNLGGAGILPLLLSSYTNFLKAEAAITLETQGDPAIFLENGIRASMNKVLSFSSVDALFAATQTEVDMYVNEVMDEYNTAVSNDDKLNIIIREYYLAVFGNSYEAYNAYRRTGYPSNIQIPIINEGTPFPRSYPYPENAINTNSSLTVKPITTKVFWDNNPDGFID